MAKVCNRRLGWFARPILVKARLGPLINEAVKLFSCWETEVMSFRKHFLFGLCVCYASVVVAPYRLPAYGLATAEQNAANGTKPISKDALAEFNSLIGGWRGVGQPKRGSAKGAWREKAGWVWDFKKNSVAIQYKIENGKVLESGCLTYDPQHKVYIFQGKFADKSERHYSGQLSKNKLVLESKPDKKNDVYRMTITRLNDKRTLVLHEKRRASQSYYTRVAEVGYTRIGTSLAVSDATGPECIVTGGTANSSIVYKGITYYVCCSGCRDAFVDDPEGILAEAKKRAAETRKKVTSKKKL